MFPVSPRFMTGFERLKLQEVQSLNKRGLTELNLILKWVFSNCRLMMMNAGLDFFKIFE